MPIRAANPAIVTPPPPPPVREKLSASWTAPDGTVWPMTDRTLGYWVKMGAVAFGAAPVNLTADANPAGGSTMRNRRRDARLITWPVHVQGRTHMEFLQRWRAVGDAFTQTTYYERPGTLTVTRPDGSARQIDADYQDGWEGQQGLGWLLDQAVMTLYCDEPLWRDVAQTVVTREHTGAATSFFTTFLTVSSSQTLGDTVITNPGDVEAWPVWTITGPATGLTATRGDTGDVFTLTPLSALLLGDTVTIDTGDGSVIGPDGSNWISAIDFAGGDVLWSLARGDTPVDFAVSGSGSGTSVSLAFYPRYATG